MIQIGNLSIGEGNPSFIIAELSANHNQNINVAIDTIRAAKKCGADAVKLQTYTPDTLTINCSNQYFQINQGTLWDGKTLYDLYKEAYTPWEWHEELFNVSKEEGLICFSSPFDKSAVDFLEELDVPAYKIASFEIQDIPLIEYTASKGKPLIISTGIAEYQDIQLAVDTCRSIGNNDIVLLKCVSSYPAPIELSNLNTIPDIRKSFSVEVGLSDHSQDIVVPVTATALGARVIEKHLILDKSLGGPDAGFSLDVKEFTEMVNAIRRSEKALGSVSYELSEAVKKNRKFARSLFAVKDIKKGECFSEENIRSIRPGYGLHPKFYKDILGKNALMSINKGTPLNWSMIS